MQGAFHVAYIAVSVYIVEIIGPSKRHYGQITSVAFGIGYMLREWDHSVSNLKESWAILE